MDVQNIRRWTQQPTETGGKSYFIITLIIIIIMIIIITERFSQFAIKLI